jgi:hypothetical protein
MKFDFSRFHPLDHWTFSKTCFGWYGGPIQHMKLWAQYQAPDPIGTLLCKLNKHNYVPWWNSVAKIEAEPTGYMCERCGIEK